MVQIKGILVPLYSVLMTMCLILVSFIPAAESLECFYCRGVTNYDPNNCFEPNMEDTFIQECPKGHVCEKKLHQLDEWQQVVERGCSNNCDGRRYIWTEHFAVHCCDNENRCNSATSNMGHWTFPALLSAMTVMVGRLLLRT